MSNLKWNELKPIDSDPYYMEKYHSSNKNDKNDTDYLNFCLESHYTFKTKTTNDYIQPTKDKYWQQPAESLHVDIINYNDEVIATNVPIHNIEILEYPTNETGYTISYLGQIYNNIVFDCFNIKFDNDFYEICCQHIKDTGKTYFSSYDVAEYNNEYFDRNYYPDGWELSRGYHFGVRLFPDFIHHEVKYINTWDMEFDFKLECLNARYFQEVESIYLHMCSRDHDDILLIQKTTPTLKAGPTPKDLRQIKKYYQRHYNVYEFN